MNGKDGKNSDLLSSFSSYKLSLLFTADNDDDNDDDDDDEEIFGLDDTWVSLVHYFEIAEMLLVLLHYVDLDLSLYLQDPLTVFVS
jgi:hypothetical protein